MAKRKKSPRYQYLTGIFSLLWAELRTLTWAKIKHIFQIVVAKWRMRLAHKKKQKAKMLTREQELRETSYRLST